jgi:hypothetical protein
MLKEGSDDAFVGAKIPLGEKDSFSNAVDIS